MSYEDYQQRMDASIRDAILERECQPILFIGSGISRRYFGAPGWHDALRGSLASVGDGGPEYEYYLQRFDGDAIRIGTALAGRVHEWAWAKGRDLFPDVLYRSHGSDQFLKYLMAQTLSSQLPTMPELLKGPLKDEIRLLQSIRAHAIITTNFDQLLECIFNGYEAIIGQRILRYNTNSFGEIYKIHGCVTDVSTMVLTSVDYDDFTENKTYLSAKLLAYFAEHPVFIFGYSFNDPNVAAILSDVGKLLADDTGLIPNLYYVRWDKDARKRPNQAEEDVLFSGTKAYRVKTIITDTFDWVFKALAQDQELKSIKYETCKSISSSNI